MTSIVLRFLDYAQSFFRWLGADYEQMRHIVAIKFLMQNRRPMAAFSHYNAQQEDTKHNNSFWWLCLLMMVFGAVVGAFIFILDVPYYSLALPFGYALTMLILTLITDFSTLLLDTTDNAVLLPRPVSSRTILLARLVYIAAYLLFLSYCLLFFTLIFTALKFGFWAFIVVFGLVFLVALIALFVTTLLYMLLIRFTSEERVKDIVSYFQILFTILVTFGYQMIGRIFDFENLGNSQLQILWWHYLLPPFWMSGTVQWLVGHSPQMWIMALMALAVPIFTFWILNRYLAPAFNQYIATLGVSDGGGSERLILQKSRGFVTRMAEWCTNTGLEKAVFELSWKITSRDRRFKMRTYPTLGSVIPLFFVFLRSAFTKGEDFDVSSKSYLIVIYFAMVVLHGFYQQTFYSEDFKAAWVYFVGPYAKPRDILLGNLKAVVVKFYTPFFAVVTTVVMYFWSFNIILDILLCYMLSLLSVMLESAMGSSFKLPFSKSPAQIKEGGQTMQLILFLIILPFCGLAHWGLTYVPYGVLGACVLVAYLLYDLYRRYERITWQQFDL